MNSSEIQNEIDDDHNGYKTTLMGGGVLLVIKGELYGIANLRKSD
jgi:hypothetical protein